MHFSKHLCAKHELEKMKMHTSQVKNKFLGRDANVLFDNFPCHDCCMHLWNLTIAICSNSRRMFLTTPQRLKKRWRSSITFLRVKTVDFWVIKGENAPMGLDMFANREKASSIKTCYFYLASFHHLNPALKKQLKRRLFLPRRKMWKMAECATLARLKPKIFQRKRGQMCQNYRSAQRSIFQPKEK